MFSFEQHVSDIAMCIYTQIIEKLFEYKSIYNENDVCVM